jgi:hypothetical protein
VGGEARKRAGGGFGDYVAKSLLLVVSLAATAGLTEAVFRASFSLDLPFLGELNDPILYADWTSDDDYWKLRYRIDGPVGIPKPHHELLGWQYKHEPETLLHEDAGSVGDRTPVLLYGDSFADCTTTKDICFQGLLNGDAEFADTHYLLNSGVGSYGVGQIYLLFRSSVDQYHDPFVVMSIMTRDLDRSILTVRNGQKPYFEIVEDELLLRGVPIAADPVEYFEHNPPQIRSYLWRFLAHNQYLPQRISGCRSEEEKRELKWELNTRLIDAMIDELDQRELRHVFVVFHPQEAVFDHDDWRHACIVGALERAREPYISSKQLIVEDMQRRGADDLSAYYKTDDGHPNEHQNNLLAAAIKGHVLR